MENRLAADARYTQGKLDDNGRGTRRSIAGTPRVARIDRVRHFAGRPGADPPHSGGAGVPRGRVRRAPALLRQHALRKHDPRRTAGTLSRRPRPGTAHQEHRALERAGHGGAGQPGGRFHRRAHLHLRFVRHALRGGVQPLLPQPEREPRGRPAFRPGPRRARYLRAGLPGRTHLRGAAQAFPPRGESARPVVLSPSLAHAGLLGVPHGIHGLRRHHRYLPGPFHEVPGEPRHQEAERFQGLGHDGRRGDGRARVSRRHHRAGPGTARQPHFRDQLQPAAARRSGPGQPQDHPGAGGHLPGRGLERHQVHLGQRLGPPAGEGRRRAPREPHARDGGRPVPEVQHGVGRVYTEQVLRHPPRSQEDGGAPVRFPAAASAAGRTRSPEGVPRVQGGRGDRGGADGHPDEDDQGIRTGRQRPGGQQHAPDQEDGGQRPAGLPGPVPDPDLRRRRGRSALLQAARRQRGDPVPSRAAPGPRRLRAVAADDLHAASRAGAGQVQQVLPGDGPAGVDDHGLREHPLGPDARQGDREPHRAHRARRGPDLRHGGPVPAVRHLFPGGTALRSGGQRNAPVLPRVEGRPAAGRGDFGSRRHVVLHRRGHGLRHLRHQHHPLLHLLLHVRAAARRRPGLVRRRHALQGIPRGRHVGPHHAGGRRAPAPGRQQPPAGLPGAEPAGL